MTEALGREGVDARCADSLLAAATRRAIIVVDARTGRRAVLEHRDPAVALGPDDLDPALVASGRVLLVDARDPALSAAAATMARDLGVPTVLDVERPGPGVEDLLRLVDVIVSTGSFATAMTGARLDWQGPRAAGRDERGRHVVDCHAGVRRLARAAAVGGKSGRQDSA